MGNVENKARKWRWHYLAFWVAFTLWTHFTTGLGPQHNIAPTLVLVLFFLNEKTARFAVLTFPILCVGLAYSNLHHFFPYRGSIHIDDLHAAELRLFGISTAQGTVIPSKFLEGHTFAFLDALCGIAYITYIAETFIMAGVLYLKNHVLLTRLAWAFLLVNLAGQATWIAWPAAPPWYVDQYGLGPAVVDALPSAAGTARFDALFGVEMFKNFYSKSVNVFGAMPSLHCAYPTLVACVLFPLGWRWRIPSIFFAALMCFSAVYLQHHYVLDVLFGILYAFAAYGVVVTVQQWRTKSSAAPKGPQEEGELDQCKMSSPG